MTRSGTNQQLQTILSLLVREFVTEICFDYFKAKELVRLPCSICGKHCHSYTTRQGYDIYGLKIDNHDANGELVECAICKKTVAASRFAPHLEKCMGLGRTARIKRNITTSSGNTANSNSGSGTKKARASTGPSSTSDLDEQLSVNAADNLSEQSSQPSSNNKKRKRQTPNSAVSLLSLDYGGADDHPQHLI